MATPWGRQAETDRIRAIILAGGSVVVAGTVGIGKTLVVNDVADDLRGSGMVVTAIHGNAAASNIPFGALSGFIDPTARIDPASQIAAATQRLRATAGHNVLLIDDAQHLDQATIAVLHGLIVDDQIPVLAAIRTTYTVPPELHELWRRIDGDRIDLAPLSPDVVRSLVTNALGEHGSPAHVDAIVERAAGNPLFVTELVRAHLAGTPTGLTPRLVDVVEQRLSSLDRAHQEQLTIVTIGQPLDVSLAAVDESLLADLEAADLIRTSEENGKLVARPAHPLYGEVIRERLTPLQRRLTSRRLAAALVDQPSRRRGEALRVVNWLIESGDRPTPELAEAAAFEAVSWLDTELAERLAHLAVEDKRCASTLFALGEVRRVSGHPEDAANIWQEAFELATGDDDIRRIALALGQLYNLFLRRQDATIEVLEAALVRIRDPSLKFGIESDLAMELATKGRHESMAAIERLLADPDCGDESAWTALSNLLWAKVSSLDLDGIDRHLRRAAETEQRLPADRDAEIDLIRAIGINVSMVRGHLDEAVDAATDWMHEAASRGIAVGLCAFSTSLIQMMRGEPQLAETTAVAALGQLAAYDSFNATPIVLCAASMAASTCGDITAAAHRLESATERSAGNAPWINMFAPRARAWLAAARGDYHQACRLATDSGKRGLDEGDDGWGLLTLHEAVAWGGADDVVDLLVRRAHHSDCALFDIVFAHATAAVERDLGGLAHCARSFESAGARSLAGAAWANRAAANSDEIESCRDATRAICLAPAVAVRPGTLERALTARQLEVAKLTATGQTSKTVAGELFLSGRTIDNHLRDVYRRLGISGRAEIREVVDPSPPISSG